MNLASSPRLLSRVAAGLLGGWVFVFGVVSLGIMLLRQAGMSYDDARTLMYLLGVLVLLAAFVSAFAVSSLVRIWVLLAGGGLAMSGAAWLMTRGGA